MRIRAMILALALSSTALAVEKAAFSTDRFDALRKQNALVLVDIYANWCPTCARQQIILSEWIEENSDAPLHILQVNYNRQRDAVIDLRATRQSTLILYHGDERIWMTVAETRPEHIHEALETGLARVH